MASASQPSNQQQADDLLATQQLLRATLDAARDMIQVFEAVRNEQGEIVDFTWILNNHAAEKFYGDVVGKSLLQLQPGVVEESIFAAFKQVVQTGQPQQYEKHYVHEQFDGWFHQSVVKLNDGVATTTADITTRKGAQQQLQQSQTLLQSVIDSSLDVIQVFKAVRDETGAILDFVWVVNNQKAVAQNGEVIGKSLLQLNPGVVPTGIFDRMVQVAQTGVASEQELYYPHEQFAGWFYQALVKTDEGVAMTTRDISRQKQAEQEILRLNAEAAKKVDDKYHAIFNAIDEGFCIQELRYDDRGNLVDLRTTEANPACERQTGFTKDVIGRWHSDFGLTTDRVWFDSYDRVAKTGEPETVEAWHELSGRWYQASLSRIREAGSRQLAVVFNDITERKQREQKQTFLLQFSDSLRAQPTADAVANRALELLIDYLHLDRSYIVSYHLAENRARLEYQLGNQTVPPLPQSFDLSHYPEAYKAVLDQTLVIEDDFDRRGLSETEKQNSARLGMRAMVAATLRKGENKPLWSMAAISSTPRRWRADEVQLIEDLAERTWTAIEWAIAEEAVYASQKRFESIANLVPDLLWESEPHGATNWYNQRWLDYTGQPFEEAIGWDWTQAIHPNDRAASASRYQDAVAAGTLFQQEYRIRRLDGVYRWFVVSTAPIKDQTGQVLKLYSAATDITDYKLAQEAIQQSEQQLAELRHLTLLAQTEALARMGSWEYDRASGQFNWSAGMYTLTQVDPRRLLTPEIYLELATEADPPPAQQLVDYLRAGAGHFETQLRIQVGQTSQTLRIKADIIGSGQDTRVVGVAMDFTQQLLAQQQIRQTADSLQAVLDGSPASIGLLKAQRDEQGHIIDFRLAVGNEKLARFFAEPLASLIGQPAQHFSGLLWDGDTLPRLRHIFTTRQGHYEEKPLMQPHQATWVALSVTRQDDGVVLTVLDITVLKQTQAQQQHWFSELEASRHSVEALSQLRTALQHRSESLRAVSHDLKSNFGIITGSLSLLELAESEAEREQFVGMALRNVQQATGLLGELLDLTRLESNEQALRLGSQNVSTLLGELGENLRALANEQGLILGISGPAVLEVETDPLLLHRLVQNLALNALKYTSQGQVSLSWDRAAASGQWWFAVEDTGSGLAPHLVARLNAPDPLQAGLEALDPSRAIGSGEPTAQDRWASLRGEGIGLRIVREIVHLLKAQLQVSSAVGAGTRFVVHLPINYSLSESNRS